MNPPQIEGRRPLQPTCFKKKHSLIIIPRSQMQTFTTIRPPTHLFCSDPNGGSGTTYPPFSDLIFGFNDCDDFEGEVVIGFSFLFYEDGF
ncbi:hypothetical protein Hdeb2414_s0002g00057661 [Helianthus debilis subsp. tardiflorus]